MEKGDEKKCLYSLSWHFPPFLPSFLSLSHVMSIPFGEMVRRSFSKSFILMPHLISLHLPSLVCPSYHLHLRAINMWQVMDKKEMAYASPFIHHCLSWPYLKGQGIALPTMIVPESKVP